MWVVLLVVLMVVLLVVRSADSTADSSDAELVDARDDSTAVPSADGTDTSKVETLVATRVDSMDALSAALMAAWTDACKYEKIQQECIKTMLK